MTRNPLFLSIIAASTLTLAACGGGSSSSSSSNSVAAGAGIMPPTNRDQIMVAMNDGTSGDEAYVVMEPFDGQSSSIGHYLLKDINPGAGNARIINIYPVEGTNAYYFSAMTDETNRRYNLFYYNGDIADEPTTLVHKVADHGQLYTGTQAVPLATLGDTAIYSGRDENGERSLYAVGPDGNEIQLMNDSYNWDIGANVEVDGNLYFMAKVNSSSSLNGQLYRTDGTTEGTELVYTSDTALMFSEALAAHNGYLYMIEYGVDTNNDPQSLTAFNLETEEATEVMSITGTSAILPIGDQVLISHGQNLYRPNPADGTSLQSLGDFGSEVLYLHNVNSEAFILNNDLYVQAYEHSTYTDTQFFKIAAINTDTPVAAAAMTLTDGTSTDPAAIADVFGTVADKVMFRSVTGNTVYSFDGTSTLTAVKDSNNELLYGDRNVLTGQYGYQMLRSHPYLLTHPTYGLMFSAIKEGEGFPGTVYASVDGVTAEVIDTDMKAEVLY